jgi:hypothetical protein
MTYNRSYFLSASGSSLRSSFVFPVLFYPGVASRFPPGRLLWARTQFPVAFPTTRTVLFRFFCLLASFFLCVREWWRDVKSWWCFELRLCLRGFLLSLFPLWTSFRWRDDEDIKHAGQWCRYARLVAWPGVISSLSSPKLFDLSHETQTSMLWLCCQFFHERFWAILSWTRRKLLT